MLLLLGLVGAGALGVAGFEGLYRGRDFRSIRLDLASRTPWTELPGEGGSRQFVCQMPFRNENSHYEQTVVNVQAEVQVLTKDPITPGALKSHVSVRCLNADGRTDGYWAATLIGAGQSTPMEVTVRLEVPEGVRLHAGMVKLRYWTYGRGPLTPEYAEVVLPLSDVKPLPEPLQGQTVAIQCVPTRILTDLDDIVTVIDEYTRSFRQPGDVVAVAESVVAITQRQYWAPAEVTVGYWARRLCYFIPSKGSLSSPHGFQLAMNQVGATRMVSSLFIGALGKVLGQHGWFYSLAGRPAELIDDVTGTMPPFDKYIVAGPKDPEKVVAAIKARTGMDAAIVDANDLKRAMVLACTDGVQAADVSRMLLDNPFGNAAEQTPIVVLRPLGAESGKGGAQRDQSCSV